MKMPPSSAPICAAIMDWGCEMSKMAEHYATSQQIEDLREQLETAASRMHIMAKAYREQHPRSDRNDLFLGWANEALEATWRL
jgi:hypothetical protein